jgi:hypothetical protein
MLPLYSSRPPSSAIYEVHTEAQATILKNQTVAEFFYPFLGHKKTVSEAAREVGCKLNAMHYRVNTFLEAGLLEVVAEQERAGRPVKVYRSVAEAFFVPFYLTAHADIAEDWVRVVEPTVRELGRAFGAAIERRGRTGQCVFRDAEGGVSSFGAHVRVETGDIVFNLDTPDLLVGADQCGDVFLTEQQAKTLQGELSNLFTRYIRPAQDNPTDGGKRERYLFIYALAPARKV